MRIVIPDDYQDVIRTLDCFGKLSGHAVSVLHELPPATLEQLAARFADAGFQQLVCETLQMNCPAHLNCRVFFLDFAQMNRFERLFKYWRSALKADRQGADKQRRALAQFIYRLNQPVEDADAPADAG
mgnify:CR=1 FL=1